MPPITRSREILSEIDGLFFIEQGVIDLAAVLYTDLRSTAATFGDEAIERLVPRVTSLLTTLNDVTKENAEMKQEIDSLRTNLSAAEGRCLDLNASFKDSSVTCCILEDQYDADITNLNNLLARCREENASLKERLDSAPIRTDRLIVESQERIDVLTAERKGLLTTIEVLEADIKCLRAELRKAENREKKRRSSTCDDLLSELLAAEEAVNNTKKPAEPNTPPATTTTSQPSSGTPSSAKDFQKVLLIGDSHVRHASGTCAERGAFVECLPGGKILDVKNRMLSYLGVSLDVIYVHVGCNNLRRGYRGGPGYDGGHGKREALHAMADLLYAAKKSFPEAKVFLSSVLVRRDISYKALHGFNTQLELMCNNFSVEFVEANTCVSRRDLSRDGVHFSRKAVSRLDSLFVAAITAMKRQSVEVPVTQSGQTSGSEPAPGSVVGANGPVLGCSDALRVLGNEL